MTRTPEPQTRYTFDRVVRMVLGAIVALAIFSLVRYLSDVLLPFAAAVVLAYLINPLVGQFQRRARRRSVAVAMTIGSLLLIATAVIVLLVPLTYGQAQRVGRDFGKLRDDLLSAWRTSVRPAQPAVKGDAGAIGEPADEPSDFAGSLRNESPPQPTDPDASYDVPAPKSVTGWRELKQAIEQYQLDAVAVPPVPRSMRLRHVQEAVGGTYIGDALNSAATYVASEDFRSLVARWARRLADAGITVISAAVNLVVGLAGLIIVLIYLVFLLLDFPEYARTWKSFLPPNYRDPIVEFLHEFDVAMRQYFRGQSVVALITGALYAIGFTLIGLPLAVPLAIVIGLLSMVPYLAAVAILPGLVLAVARSVEQDSSLIWSIVLLFIVFGVVQTLQDTVVTPRVMGKATGLKPVAILLGVFIWGKLLGFLGILLAIPLTCLFIAYYRRYVLRHSVEMPAIPAPLPMAPVGETNPTAKKK